MPAKKATKKTVKKAVPSNAKASLLEFEPGTIAGPPSTAYVKKKERMLGNPFDPAFLAFLQEHNGGVPKQRLFKVGRNEKVLERFLCLLPDYEDNALGDYDIGVVWSDIEDRLSDFLVPFAAVFAGDFLCFDHEDANPPRVVLWNHDLSEEDEPSTVPVADSFEAFLGMLYAG